MASSENHKKQILAAIAAGDYTIRTDRDCCCNHDWHIDDNDQLTDDLDASDCWVANALVVGGEDIMYSVVGAETQDVSGCSITLDDLPAAVAREVVIHDDAENALHTARTRESLIEWLREQVAAGYRLMRDPQRGFANEYRMLLVAPGAEVDEDWDDIATPEQWADGHLYNGDDATQACNSFGHVWATPEQRAGAEEKRLEDTIADAEGWDAE